MTAPDTVTNVMLPCVCMECGATYQYINAYRPLRPGEVSHGYCIPCEPVVMERWFGKRQPASLDVERLR